MRKFVFALVMVAVLCVGCAFADDGEKIVVDDVTLGKAYKIKGYAVVTFHDFGFADNVSNGPRTVHSGSEAEIACLRADIRNLSKKDAKFLGSMSVRAVFDDEYEYNGFTLARNNEDQIGPLYVGHYGFFCELPNFVVQDKTSPLKMIITINGHEFTYHIRK